MKAMNAQRCLGAGIGLLFLGMIGVSEAASWDATAEFSLVNGNPNGVWSYGWMPSDFSTLNLFTNSNDGSVFQQWYTPGMSGDYTPTVAYNHTTSAQYGVAPGQLTLHPGPGGQAAVLRFTAPQGGRYDLMGQFLPGDGGTMAVGIRQDSGWLFQATDAGAFDLQDLLLVNGESVDFVVYGGYAYGNTPLEATVSTVVPLPAAVWLFASGLGMLSLVQRRARDDALAA